MGGARRLRSEATASLHWVLQLMGYKKSNRTTIDGKRTASHSLDCHQASCPVGKPSLPAPNQFTRPEFPDFVFWNGSI